MQAVRASIIVPMRNARAYVGAALRSVLEETDVPLEVIVVDDGSSDGSGAAVAAIADRRIRVVDGPRNGIAAAFNTGLAHSTGEFVMRCDADDLYTPGRISRQIGWLDQNLEFGATCGAFAAMNARGRNRLPFRMAEQAEEITSELRSGEMRTHFCTFAIRSDLLKAIGGARPFFLVGEDLDLQLRVGDACRVWYEPEITYVYRLHDASITHSMREQERVYYEKQARAFQIQRADMGVDDLQRGKIPEFIPSSEGDKGSASLHMRDLLIAGSWSAYQDGARIPALRYAFQAALSSPRSWTGWRNLAVVSAKVLRPKPHRPNAETETP